MSAVPMTALARKALAAPRMRPSRLRLESLGGNMVTGGLDCLSEQA